MKLTFFWWSKWYYFFRYLSNRQLSFRSYLSECDWSWSISRKLCPSTIVILSNHNYNQYNLLLKLCLVHKVLHYNHKKNLRPSKICNYHTFCHKFCDTIDYPRTDYLIFDHCDQNSPISVNKTAGSVWLKSVCLWYQKLAWSDLKKVSNGRNLSNGDRASSGIASGHSSISL